MNLQTTLTTAKAWHLDVAGFSPEDVVPTALIMTAATKVGSVEGDEPAVRVPWVADDGAAGFVPEGQPIPETNAAFTETVVRTNKVAVLGKFSREQIEQPDAARLITNAMSRSVIRKADTAFLSNAADPTGLLNLNVTDGGSLGANLDALSAAIVTIEADGGTPSHVIAAPDAWGTLSTLKTATGSAATLLGAAADMTERRVLGLPVITTPAMPAGQMLVVDKSSILAAVGDVKVARSDDAFFASDVVGIRVTFRIGWAVMHPERVVKITTTTA